MMREGAETAFLFTDIEGSSRLWEHHPDAMPMALSRHDDLMRAAITSQGGEVFSTGGDGFCAAFVDVVSALAAALTAQQALRDAQWPTHTGPLAVRMAVHYGNAQCRDGNYFGPTLNRCARVLSAGHGGQVLLTRRAVELLGGRLPASAQLSDLGECQLRDLVEPEHVCQLVHPDLPDDFPPLRGLQAFPNNIPVQPTSFVGRTREMAQIKRQLRQTRLLTLTGLGGVGKTRLAMHVGADVLHQFADGVWVAELASLSDPELIPPAVCSVLEMPDELDGSPMQSLMEHLHTKQVLLILDNCEHMLEGTAALVDGLLRSCPGVVILATSRQALGVSGEALCRMSPLTTPRDHRRGTRAPDSRSSVTTCESAQLLVDRLVAREPNFALTSDNAVAVARICQKLDGIPLALELAASWVSVLMLSEIARRLDDRFQLLRKGVRTASSRQRTLRGAMDWSYELLAEPERALLRRLSVFVGGWTLEAAETVTTDHTTGPGAVQADDVLELLGELVEKSLVVVDGSKHETRYRLLETVRQYAAGKLDEAGEAEATRRRHRDYYAQVAEQAGPERTGREQNARLARLHTEDANLRAALEWSLAAGETEQASRIFDAPVWYWHVHCPFHTTSSWVSSMLSALRDKSHGLRAKVLVSAAGFAYLQGNHEGAAERASEGLKLARRLGDQNSAAYALMMLGHVAMRGARYEQAKELLRESLQLARELSEYRCTLYSLNCLANSLVYTEHLDEGEALHSQALALAQERNDTRGIAWAYTDLGFIARCRGNHGRAEELYQQGLDVAQRSRDRMVTAYALNLLGDLSRIGDRPLDAFDRHARSLRILTQLGDKPEVATCLEGIAKAAIMLGDHEASACLHGAAEALREACGAPIPMIMCAEHNECVRALREALDAEVVERQWRYGRTMGAKDAVAYAQQLVGKHR